jgi:hypothetical protein
LQVKRRGHSTVMKITAGLKVECEMSEVCVVHCGWMRHTKTTTIGPA